VSVYQRPDRKGGKTWCVNFVVIYPDGERVRVRSALPNVRTKAEAQREAARLQAESQNAADASSSPQPAPPSQPTSGETVTTFADRWLAYVRIHYKPSTLNLYMVVVEQYIKPHLGDRAMSDLTPALLDGWKATIHRPDLSGVWLNQVVGILSSMCARAVKWRVLPANPCAALEKFPTKPPELEWYTTEETGVWLATCLRVAPHVHPLCLLGFRTGLRIGELCALRWSAVDFRARRLEVRASVTLGLVGEDREYVETEPKSNRRRLVDVPPDALAMLAELPRGAGEYVFTQPENGRPWIRSALMRTWNRVCGASGLKRIGIHGMRHSYASQLASAGVPLNYIQHQLGHSTIRLTERYAHLAPEGKRWADMLSSREPPRVT
jgi:integrase